MNLTPEQASELIRRLAFAIENVLDESTVDDGWVSPTALSRLWEVYQVDIKPLGSTRTPIINMNTTTTPDDAARQAANARAIADRFARLSQQ